MIARDKKTEQEPCPVNPPYPTHIPHIDLINSAHKRADGHAQNERSSKTSTKHLTPHVRKEREREKVKKSVLEFGGANGETAPAELHEAP